MTILWMNLAIVFFFAFFARYFSKVIILHNSIELIRPNKMLVFFALLSLVLVAGLRSGIGDTGAYKDIYIRNDFTWDYIMSQKDIGFGIIQMLLKKFSNDPQILLFTCAVMTNLLVVLTFYKYSRIFEISLFVYITDGWFLTSMNGMRQCLAAAIVFAATKFLLEGNWKRYFLIVLLASTIHESAMILLPVYFIVRRKAWTGTTFALLLFSILIVIGYNQFTDVLFTALKDSQYAAYKNFNEGGANIIRVAVDATPLIIAFIGRHKLRSILPYSDYIVNLSIIGILFMIVSTQQWIFARFSIYFTLYQIILISWIIKLFKTKTQKLIYMGILICYLIYHYYEDVISLNIYYTSNYLKYFFP